jgi:hypothetical protein
MQTETQTEQWLTVPQASAVLLVSEKTVRRRIKAGELPARKESLDGGGNRWIVQVDTGLDTRRNPVGQRNGHAHAQTETGLDNALDTLGTDMDKRAGTGLDIAVADRREIEAELRAQLVREREFSATLKSQLEAVTQSEAQTKAALREALRAMPKALPMATDAPAPPETTQIAKAPIGSHDDAIASRRPASAQESAPIDYNSIADGIERRLQEQKR